MKINPISNNNTSFNAQFMYDKGIYKDLLNNKRYQADITDKTLELAKRFTKIGKGQKLEILEVKDHGNEYYYTSILNTFNNQTRCIMHPKDTPFWEGLLSVLVANTTSVFYELNNNLEKFHNIVTSGK